MRRLTILAGTGAIAALILGASCGSSTASTGGSQSVAWSQSISASYPPGHHPPAASRPGLPTPVYQPGTDRVAVTPAMRAMRRTSTFDWSNEFTALCERDPSSGGAGTAVLDSTCSTSNAEDWVEQANGTCGGTVTRTCPGGWISANLRGAFVVTSRNIGEGPLCEGANTDTVWTVTMRTCDGVNGQHLIGTLYAWATGGCGTLTDNAFWSFAWNTAHADAGAIGDSQNGGTNTNVVVADNFTHCADGLWQGIGS